MMNIDLNNPNYKPNMLMKIGGFIGILGLAYKTGGIKYIFTYIIINIKTKYFKWKYRHCKKFRTKLQEETKKKGPVSELLLANIMEGTPIDLKEIYNNLTSKQKEDIIKSKDTIVNQIIEEFGITDKNLIETFKSSLDFNK